MDPYVRELLHAGMNHSHVRVKQTEFVRTLMYASLGKILKTYDYLICPTLAVPSVDAWHQCDDPDYTINDQPVDAMLQWCLTYPFNLVSQCPVATVPTGFAGTGVPTGMQIVGRTYDDVSVFRAAAAYEQAKPWRNRTPDI